MTSPPSDSEREKDREQQHHKHVRYNIYVSGLDTERYPVLKGLEGDARGLMPTMFGLSYLGTNRFDSDFIEAVHEQSDEGREQAFKQLREVRGFMPLFNGIPSSDQELPDPWRPKTNRRGYAKGQAKRMRAGSDTEHSQHSGD